MRIFSIGRFTIALLFPLLTVLFLIACTNKKEPSPETSDSNESTALQGSASIEAYRPGFHFTPPSKWMNDPNGLVFNDGIYHLFYQYYPDDIVWGPMHWGHATSKDLLHWNHQEVALYPDSLGYIFSGSAVVDHDNSSGLGENGVAPLVAIFTYHDPEKEKAKTNDHQTQGIAYSLDNGKTWTKYSENPVLGNSDKRDFRDPKVFWHKGSSQWIMCLAVGDHIEFYRSENLKDWSFLSEFGKDVGAHGGVWECPDLFKMKTEKNGKEHWVLLVSINPGGPNGGSATQYFIGDFDGKQFYSDQAHSKWLDHGADNYAGVTYNNTPDRRRLFIGWMSNWNYAQNTPTKSWRSAMTLPRELVLNQSGDSLFVSSRLTQEFLKLGKTMASVKKSTLEEELIIEGDFNKSFVSWTQNLKDDIHISFGNQKGESIQLQLDPGSQRISFDRSNSGLVDFHERFADKPHTLTYLPENRKVSIQVVLDRSSMEVFIDNGRWVMTEQFFPTSGYDRMKLRSSNDIEITDLTIKELPNTIHHE